jgi:hypothetical protein
MIDLTQGEGNKRVRKRNKKPTKGQLAAQAAAEAYRASTRLPGQGGDSQRPTPYLLPSHSHTRSQVIEEDSGDDQYQAPPMQTNFMTTAPAEEPHRSLLHNSALQHPGPSPRQRQLAEQPYQPTTSADHSPLTLHQNPDLDHDANIDPTLRVSSKDGLAAHTISGSSAALHHEILSQRSVPTSTIQPGAVQLPMQINMLPIGAPQIQQQASANPQAQTIFTHPSLMPPQPPYNHPRLSLPGPGSQPSQVVSALHVPPQHTQSLLQQQLQPIVNLPLVAMPQTAPAQNHTPRLPPMRTLSGSPPPSTPPPPLPQQQQQQSPSSSGGNSGGGLQPSPQQDTVAGFGRYAHAPTGFPKPAFGKPAIPVVPLTLPIRPLLQPEAVRGDADKGKRRAYSRAAGDQAGDDERRGSSRRHFVPLSPRPGIEYVHGADGGLVSARRSSGRYGECTVDWINNLEGGERS